MITQFRLGCELNYKVSGPSAFIFNVSVINNSLQRIVAEEFTTEPQLHVEESRSPIEEKRHHRFTAADGPLCVRYWATIELSFHIQADNVPETPPGALPADVVAYLYPAAIANRTSSCAWRNMSSAAAARLFARDGDLQLDS